MQSATDVNLLMRRPAIWTSRIALLAMSALGLLGSVSAAAEVRISPEPRDPDTATLTQTLRDALASASPQAAALDARVTIGAAAFREALAQDDAQPLIATYLTSIEFQAVLGSRERPPHVTAVFSNPDPIAQVALARQLLGQAAVGVFDSPAVHPLVSRITAQGVRAIPVSAQQGVDSLLRSAQALDAILVLPDPAVLNRSNINHVVRTLYQQRRVLIGHSETLTRIGALASAYASREAVARRVARVIEQYAKSGVLSDPSFVRELDVAINERLARSLNIAVPDRSEVTRIVRLAAAEAAP